MVRFFFCFSASVLRIMVFWVVTQSVTLIPDVSKDPLKKKALRFLETSRNTERYRVTFHKTSVLYQVCLLCVWGRQIGKLNFGKKAGNIDWGVFRSPGLRGMFGPKRT